jgi:hypothetical protein
MPPHPWDRLRVDWPHVDVLEEDLGTQWAETRWLRSGRMLIVLNQRLNQAERRVCVTHECAHLEYGRPHGTLKFSEEAKVRNAAARWLLPDLDVIGETLATYDAHRAAEELWVTFPVLIDRLNDLSDAESYHVQSFREGTA